MTDAVDIFACEPNAELIWASPRELLNIFQADAIGCHIITVTHDILKKLPTCRQEISTTTRSIPSRCSTTMLRAARFSLDVVSTRKTVAATLECLLEINTNRFGRQPIIERTESTPLPEACASIPLEVFGASKSIDPPSPTAPPGFLPTMPSDDVQLLWTGAAGHVLLAQSLSFVRTLGSYVPSRTPEPPSDRSFLISAVGGVDCCVWRANSSVRRTLGRRSVGSLD